MIKKVPINRHPRSRDLVRIIATLAALVALFGAGYWVYHVVGQLLFRAQSAATVPIGLILGVAVLGGAASFFSPCSLAITPSFLLYFVGNEREQSADTRRRELLRPSLLIALGIVGLYGVAAILVSTIGALIYNFLIYLIPLVGVLFAALGVIILFGRSSVLSGAARYLPGYSHYERILSHGARGPRELISFGAAYGAASHSCTLPIFLGVILLPLAAGVYWLAALAVLLYGLSLAGLMMLMLALGQPAVLAMRRWVGRYLHYAVGVLFLATAGYLFYYFILNYGFGFLT